MMRALLVYPTHENCAEIAKDAVAAGLDAMVYPGRSTDTEKGANCWNLAADEAERVGFPVIKTVCPTCPHKSECGENGYLAQLIAVQEAEIAVCTHKRAEYSGLRDLSSTRPFVSIHENAISILRPKCECSATDLHTAHTMFRLLLNDPKSLDWFGDASSIDENGERYHSEEVGIRRHRLYEFCMQTAKVVEDLRTMLGVAVKITEWSIPHLLARPLGIERLLFRTGRAMGLQFGSQPWRFILAASAGELQSAAVVVYQPPAKNKRKNPDEPVVSASPVKTLLGFRLNPPSTACVTWFNDATISADRLSSVLNFTVQDKTPQGTIALQKKAVQVVRDITRQTSAKTVLSILRGVLTERADFQRIGIIGHTPHMKAIKSLDQEFARRIVRMTYFGSGEERSSNAWHHECDLIIILGTPRMPPNVIRNYLIQIGRVGAAAREATWGPIRWTGRTESGQQTTVAGRGYHDEDWRQAHLDQVRAALVQAIGRGRGILESGCEVLVLSNEECGVPLSDAPISPLTPSELTVLLEIRKLTAVFANNRYIGKTAVSTSTVAAKVGLSNRQSRTILTRLDERGLVTRTSERGDWLPVDQDYEPLQVVEAAALHDLPSPGP